MYALRPMRVYIADAVFDDNDALARTKRMLNAMNVKLDDAVRYDRDSATDMVRQVQTWPWQTPVADVPIQHQRVLIFTPIILDGSDCADDPLIVNCPEGVSGSELAAALGYISPVQEYHNPEKDANENMVCWNTRDFGTMRGCPHGCQYCTTGKGSKSITVGVNIDAWMNKVIPETIAAHPDQKCFRMIGWGADHIAFEPEAGVIESFAAALAKHEGRYGYFHTASDNVDFLEHMPNRDRMIGVFSITTPGISELIEPGAPSTFARIEAARKCKQWNIPVRLKFKPAIPIRNWRQEYAETIERIFDTVVPETLGAGMMMWTTFDGLTSAIDPDVLDPEFIDAAKKADGTFGSDRTGPFPHDIRAMFYRFIISEIRKHDKCIPIYISTESRQMWDELHDELGQNPRHFICGCNPVETPGPTLRPSGKLAHSTYPS